MDNKAGKKTNEDDNIEFEEINDGPNEEGTPVNEKNSTKILLKVNKEERLNSITNSWIIPLKEHQRLTRRD
jgi:hypothetical protein